MSEDTATDELASICNDQNIQKGQWRDSSQLPHLSWDIGTAYDLFISLEVLLHPEDFGLRASWAAGVRSRLNSEERDILESCDYLCGIPLHWIFSLKQPKNATSALYGLHQISAEKRLETLVFTPDFSPKIINVYRNVSARQKWNEKDLENLRAAYLELEHENKKRELIKNIEKTLDTWTDAAGFGERYLSTLESYYRAFFAEEEQRIRPVLEERLHQAQELAEHIPLDELFEKLSQGIHFKGFLSSRELILAPSYWITPLIMFEQIAEGKTLVMFGARPPEASLVPGEVVPDALLRGLKAVSDPTRLSILRFLSQESMTPAELSRLLRLRAPTVTHHLKALRLAGLVHLSFDLQAEGHYAARLEAITELYTHLMNYLINSSMDEAIE